VIAGVGKAGNPQTMTGVTAVCGPNKIIISIKYFFIY
jgi:urease alpha subunit